MITGIIHPGSGLGDQLFSYIVTRVRALDLGVEFGFVGKENFKGNMFLPLDWGEESNYTYKIEESTGRLVVYGVKYGENLEKIAPCKPALFEINKPFYDPQINFIQDDTVIDGFGAQDIRYFEHRLDEIREWLSIKPGEMADDVCVINFRGGEYSLIPELFLPKRYWELAIKEMQSKYPNIKFEVHTDDPKLASDFFPDFPVIHGIEVNWKSIRYAKHLIISNSAFAIIPALLNENVKQVLAPRFWAGRNVHEWRRPQNYYKKFTYI